MSKYTEAITMVDDLGICDSCRDYDRSELNTIIIEALEIADRLEQIVHCSECIWRKKNGFCIHQKQCGYRNDDWFCADGERETDNVGGDAK